MVKDLFKLPSILPIDTDTMPGDCESGGPNDCCSSGY